MSEKKRVCIIGCGNWGSSVAKIVGTNCAVLPQFDTRVTMVVHEEYVAFQKLSYIINTTHQNPKYLPGFHLPENVYAEQDVVKGVQTADILLFVLSHEYVIEICRTIEGMTKENVIAVSLIKGFDVPLCNDIELTSHIISRYLHVPCSIMAGATLVKDVAKCNLSEITLGYRDPEHVDILKQLFQTDYFRVVAVPDADAVEFCSALKNIVGLAAGFADGLGLGDNTKAAIIRLGLMEIIHFAEEYLPHCKLSTFLESCGLGDLIATCYAGNTRLIAEQFVILKKKGEPQTFKKLQKSLISGKHLQGPATAETVAAMVKDKGVEGRFPLFIAVNEIVQNLIPPEQLVDRIKNHPVYRKIF